jgi:hypothetical protein
MSIINLPSEIIIDILSLLCDKEKNNLLSSAKRFMELKYTFFVLNLNYDYSVYYYYDDIFRNRINSSYSNIYLKYNEKIKLSKLSEEIGLFPETCSKEHSIIIDLNKFINAKGLKLHHLSRDIYHIQLPKLENLHLLLCECHSLENIRNLKSLKLDYCFISENNFNSLKNLYKLEIISTFDTIITNRHLHFFKDICDLAIINCSYITDISPLINIKKLNLSGCVNIMNLSILRNCHTLNLSRCKQLTNEDLYSFSNVHDLNISYCYNIFDLTPLTNIFKLNLTKCLEITNEDISVLSNINNLNLSGCSKITDISSLHNKILNVSSCINITNLGNLYNVNTIYLPRKCKIIDTTVLNNVPNVILTLSM